MGCSLVGESVENNRANSMPQLGQIRWLPAEAREDHQRAGKPVLAIMFFAKIQAPRPGPALRPRDAGPISLEPDACHKLR